MIKSMPRFGVRERGWGLNATASDISAEHRVVFDLAETNRKIYSLSSGRAFTKEGFDPISLDKVKILGGNCQFSWMYIFT